MTVAAAAPTAHAQTYTWDANGTTAGQNDGAGAWLGAGQWWDGTTNQTWISGANAIFGIGGTGGTVTLASPTAVGTITFNTFTGTYTLGTAGQALTVNGGITLSSTAGAVTFASPITLGATQAWSNASPNALTVAAVTGTATTGNTQTITVGSSGAGGITLGGVIGDGTGGGKVALTINNTAAGATTLSGANTFSGGVTLIAGQVANIGLGIYQGFGSGTLTIQGGNLHFGNVTGGVTIPNTMTWSNTLLLSRAGTGSPTATFSGNATLAGNFAISISGSQPPTGVVFNGNIDEATGGPKSLSLSGTTTYTLAGNNSFTGGLSTTAGFLNINSASALGTGTFTIGAPTVLNNTTAAAIALSTNNAQNWNSSFSFTGTNGLNLGSGAVTLGTNVTVTVNSNVLANTLIVGGAIGQTGGNRVLTKAGVGTLVVSGGGNYLGGTTVSGGTLLWSGANNLPGTGTLTVNNGGTFSLADGTARATTGATSGTGVNLATGSTLVFDWVGSSLDSITTTGTATTAAGSFVVLDVRTNGATGSGGTLLSATGASTLNNATYLLANNTDYTATITKTATSVEIGTTAATPLTDAYWLGGQVTGAVAAMTISTGAASNWASNATGTSVGVVPGGSAVNAIFGASGATQQASVTTGTDINLGSITFNDAATVNVAGNSTITLNSTTATAATTTGAGQAVTAGSAISVTAFANATNTISARVALAANQTWNVAAGKTLTVSGAVSGTGSLTKADAGTLVLSNTNSYTGGTTIAGGTLNFSGSALGTSGNITVSGGTLQWASGNTLDISGRLTLVNGGNARLDIQANTVTLATGFGGNTSSSLTKSGSGVLLLSGTNTYSGGTVVTAGRLNVPSDAALGNSSGSITLNGGVLGVNTTTGTGNQGGTNLSSARDVIIGAAGGGIAVNGNNNFTTTGRLRGSGQLTKNAVSGSGNQTLNFSSTSNDFTGALVIDNSNTSGIGNIVTFNSLADSSGSGRIVFFNTGGTSSGTFTWDTGATSNLVLNNRQFEISGVSNNTINNANTTRAIVVNTNLIVSGAAGARTLTLNAVAGPTNVFAGTIADGTGTLNLSKAGSGTWILSGANGYTGTTSVTAGTLVARSGSALGSGTGAVTVATNTGLAYNAATDTALTIGGTLAITGGTTTVIGTSIGTTATSAQINVTGAASITNAAHRINIYGVNGVSHATGLVTLIQGGAGSSLNPATAPTLGTVFNNTDFTVGAFTRTANALQVTTAGATALTAAYWVGGLGGNTNVWAASNGSTASNWRDATGAASAVVPGSDADVVISTRNLTTPINPTTAPTATVLGTDMTIRSLTISDTTTGLGLNADGYRLTIAGAAGITMDATVPASTIAANVALGASQTWTNNSSNALTVSGVVSGANTLTKAGTGTIVLSGINAYTGSTTVSAGILRLGATGALPTSSAVTLNGGTLAAAGGTANATSGALTVSASSSIDFGGAGSSTVLSFGDSSAASWTGTLTIIGYTGPGGSASSSTTQLFIGGSPSLTVDQLNAITFTGYTLGAAQLPTGEIVPAGVVPEPGTILGIAAAGLGLGRFVRRRLRKA
jgi:autotransporter-associated beta strand protein